MSYALEQNSLLIPPRLAANIGLEQAVVLQQLYYCTKNPKMGTEFSGEKWIRNPIICTDSEKVAKAEESGKAIDWLSNFPWLSPWKIRKAFAALEKAGLIKSKKIRARKYDQTKYYTIIWDNLLELMKRLQLSICELLQNRSGEGQKLDLPDQQKSYQDHSFKDSFQVFPPSVPPSNEKTGEGEILKSNRIKRKKRKPITKKEVEVSTVSLEAQEEIYSSISRFSDGDNFSAAQKNENYQEFFENLLAYCQIRTDLTSPEGYAHWVLNELKSGNPSEMPKLLWEEYCCGEELGSRLTAPGFRLRGVPESLVASAILQDCQSKVGTTSTEAAVNAAQKLQKPSFVVAAATAIKNQLQRRFDDSQKQVALGVAPESAIQNVLPVYVHHAQENLSFPESTPLPDSQENPALDSPGVLPISDESPSIRTRALILQVNFGLKANPKESLLQKLRELIDDCQTDEDYDEVKSVFANSPIPTVRRWAEHNLDSFFF